MNEHVDIFQFDTVIFIKYHNDIIYINSVIEIITYV